MKVKLLSVIMFMLMIQYLGAEQKKFTCLVTYSVCGNAELKNHVYFRGFLDDSSAEDMEGLASFLGEEGFDMLPADEELSAEIAEAELVPEGNIRIVKRTVITGNKSVDAIWAVRVTYHAVVNKKPISEMFFLPDAYSTQAEAVKEAEKIQKLSYREFYERFAEKIVPEITSYKYLDYKDAWEMPFLCP